MIDGAHIHLNKTPYTSKTIEQESILLSGAKTAITTAATATQQVAEATSSAISSATKGAAIKAAHAKQDAANVLGKAASYVSTLGHDAATALSAAAQSVSATIGHAATDAVHKAQEVGEKVVDTTAEVAGTVSHKTRELAEGAAHKAHEVADNIVHFTHLVSVLAAEEKERARRLSEDESTAIINALKLSEIIRGLELCIPYYIAYFVRTLITNQTALSCPTLTMEPSCLRSPSADGDCPPPMDLLENQMPTT